MNEPYITNGVIFDPFALHCAGLTRKLSRMYSRDDIGPERYTGKPAHNEAKFKQAFINACHFAETMTVIGPICQLTWDLDSTDFISPALRWPVDTTLPENAWFHDMHDTLLRTSTFCTANIEDPGKPGTTYANIISDHIMNSYLPTADVTADAQWVSGLEDLYYRHNNRSQFPKIGNGVPHNAPMLGVMAVIFTYKKRNGCYPVEELTNLGVFPTTTFLLPVLVPAYPGDKGTSSLNLMYNQPVVSTYQIKIDPANPAGAWDSHRLTPYGSPYRFLNVDIFGKSSDCLRSLSDVFSSLWSQATLYSAWNLGVSPDRRMGCLYLEPMGAGRRIRGYNRFKNYYQLAYYDASFHTYDASNNPQQALLAEGHPLTVKEPLYYQQQASKRANGTSHMHHKHLFVLPSFLSNSTVFQALQPLCFQIMSLSEIHQVSTFSERFMLGLSNNLNALLDDTRGVDTTPKHPRPIERIKGKVTYDADGNPGVFQMALRISSADDTKRLYDYANDVVLDSAQRKALLASMEMTQSHGFTEVFCSSSPTDLTKTFKEMPKESKKGSKKKELVEQTDIIDLFGDSKALF